MRERLASIGSSRLATSSSRADTSPPQLTVTASCARTSSARAWSGASSGPASAMASSSRAASGSPASSFASAPTSARRAAGRGRGWRSPAQETPPRRRATPRCARPADRSSSPATSSSGPSAACARCQARRSGRAGSVARRGRRGPAAFLGRGGAGRRPSGRGGDGSGPASRTPQARQTAARGRGGRCRAARGPPDRTGSPVGSAAASSIRRCFGSGKLGAGEEISSSHVGRTTASAGRKPAGQLGGGQSGGNSSSASGLPRVSATIRSRIRWSTPGSAPEAACARPLGRPSIVSAAAPPSSSLRRDPEDQPYRFGESRRATKASTWAEARSATARRRAGTEPLLLAASARRLSTARPTRRRPAIARIQPERDAQRVGLRPGGRRRSSSGAQSWCRPRTQLHLGLDAGKAEHAEA